MIERQLEMLVLGSGAVLGIFWAVTTNCSSPGLGLANQHLQPADSSLLFCQRDVVASHACCRIAGLRHSILHDVACATVDTSWLDRIVHGNQSVSHHMHLARAPASENVT